MFGLPIYRMYTQNTTPCILFSCCQGIGCFPPKLKIGIRVLPEMSFNHYSLLVSQDYLYVASWGGCASFGRTGVTANNNKPTTSIINWKGAIAQPIAKIHSKGAWDSGNFPYTIFRTETNDLYGTGENGRFFLNQASTGTIPTFELITSNVTNFCMAGDHYMLYVKTDEKVYGLGPGNFGFGLGPTLTNLTKDDGSGINYLGVDNASKVYCTIPEGQSKSFVLKKDGTVMACGHNTDGCLGVNKTDAVVDTWQTVKKSDDGGVTFSTLTDVIDVITTNFVVAGGANASSAEKWTGTGGNDHMTTYFLTSTGHVYTCGNNRYGQLGIGSSAINLTKNHAVSAKNLTTADRICSTAGGTSILVTASASGDKVFVWGNNQWGQLGVGDRVHKTQPTEATSLSGKKIRNIHGGGMYGAINGAFVVATMDGDLYSAGFNQTFALGVTNAGVPNPGPIITFTKNEYFGKNPTQNQDPERYPLTITGDISAGSVKIKNATMFQNKTVLGTLETVYVQEHMDIFGDGISPDTSVTGRDFNNQIIEMSKPATKTVNGATFTFENRIYVQNADLCGYGTEMAQKIVTDDGTLYMSGWNQSLGDQGPKANPCFNFNYYIGTENVGVPTYFDAKKFS